MQVDAEVVLVQMGVGQGQYEGVDKVPVGGVDRVLVLKRILALNRTMPVTIDEFRVGRQITFPTEQELKDKYHVIDYDAARYFYEVINYYPEFEKAFNRDSAKIIYQMQELEK